MPKTQSQDNLPESGKQIAYTAHRAGVAERCADPAVHQHGAVALALITADDRLRGDVALAIVKAATPHDAHPLYRLHTVPGSGPLRRLVLLDAMHAMDRLPTVPDCVSYGRLGQGAKAAAGPR